MRYSGSSVALWWVVIGIGTAVTLAALVLLATADQFEASMTLLSIGLAALIGAGFQLRRLTKSQDRRRELERGNGLVARWRVAPRDWERFLAIDQAWRKGGGTRLFKPAGRGDGLVDILVGEEEVLIDGSYHRLKGWGRKFPDDVVWLPTIPLCIEFALLSTGEDVTLGTLRIPVPDDAREAGERAFAYWDRQIPRDVREDLRRRWKYDPRRGPR